MKKKNISLLLVTLLVMLSSCKSGKTRRAA